MSAINKEIEEYYNTLVFKDNAKTQYFYDIIAKRDNIEYPLISILQNRRQATGADRFKQAMERIVGNNNITSVVVKEYNNCSDEAEPISVNEFELQRSKKMKKKNALQKPQGFGSLEDTNTFLSGFGRSLDLLGIQGGLSGIIQNSAMQIAQATQLEQALGTITDLKGEKHSLEDDIKALKKENEELKDSIKKQEYQLWDVERKKDNEIADLKRDLKQKEEQFQNKLSIGSLATTSFLNIISRKYKLDEKLDGLLSDDTVATPQPTSTPTADLSSVNIEPTNPDTASYIEEINRYLNTLDKSRIELVSAIIQYLSLGDNEMRKIYTIVSNHYKQQDNGTV